VQAACQISLDLADGAGGWRVSEKSHLQTVTSPIEKCLAGDQLPGGLAYVRFNSTAQHRI
jgi:hypothetical protein